jgi:predicted transcriptional regulator of viral defense system
MTTEKQFYKFLTKHTDDIEGFFDESNIHIFTNRQLINFLSKIESFDITPFIHFFSTDYLIPFLTKNSHLRQVSFNTPRVEKLYLWRDVNKYLLMPMLRQNGYYSHLTSLYFHQLQDQEPIDIYYNHEQPIRSSLGILEQSRINTAFNNRQRITSAQTRYDQNVFWLLNGKQTGNFGTELIDIPNGTGTQILVTNLERTLIDIVVRPAYSGGTKNILRAYQMAQSKILVDKLIETMNALNYVYPYHQSIGFYIDKAGVYDQKFIRAIKAYKPFTYDFYLDYHMIDPQYSQEWKIYYPRELI